MLVAAPKLAQLLEVSQESQGKVIRRVFSNVPPDQQHYHHHLRPLAPRREWKGVDFWSKELLSFISTGRLQFIDRIATIIQNLEPKTASLLAPFHHHYNQNEIAAVPSLLDEAKYAIELQPLSVQLVKNVKVLVFIENLFTAQAMHAIFRVVDKSRSVLCSSSSSSLSLSLCVCVCVCVCI